MSCCAGYYFSNSNWLPHKEAGGVRPSACSCSHSRLLPLLPATFQTDCLHGRRVWVTFCSDVMNKNCRQWTHLQNTAYFLSLVLNKILFVVFVGISLRRNSSALFWWHVCICVLISVYRYHVSDNSYIDFISFIFGKCCLTRLFIIIQNLLYMSALAFSGFTDKWRKITTMTFENESFGIWIRYLVRKKKTRCVRLSSLSLCQTLYISLTKPITHTSRLNSVMADRKEQENAILLPRWVYVLREVQMWLHFHIPLCKQTSAECMWTITT